MFGKLGKHPGRDEMLECQLRRRNITDEAVLTAMAAVDRRLFVPDDLRSRAYADGPLPIGYGQTISQPYVVAYMLQKLALTTGARVLEAGSGCGYNAAVLSYLAKQVYSIEIVEQLKELAEANLAKAGIDNVQLRLGDAYYGWPEHAPFDAIILTAATPEIPPPLKQQLKIGGRLLAPVGKSRQKLLMLKKQSQADFEEESLLMVSFVPFTGEAQQNG